MEAPNAVDGRKAPKFKARHARGLCDRAFTATQKNKSFNNKLTEYVFSTV